MSTYSFQGKQIYYEVHGSGKPLILLNGIMMSTMSWQIFVKALSQNNQLILLDFLDQGKSDKFTETYTHDLQVQVLKGLIEELGLSKVNLVGISYGGEIALNFAVQYQHMVDRMVIFNASYRTSPWLKDIGDAWNLSAGDAMNYYLTTIPVIYSPQFYNTHRQFMEERKKLLVSMVFNQEPFMESMVRLTKSSEEHDVEKQLKDLNVRTLIVSSENDFITPKEEQETMHQLMPCSDLVVLPKTGHASMYEKPALFTTLVLGFINASDLDMTIL